MSDMVNHPPHYKAAGIEAIDVIEAFGLDFNRGNAVKYLLRAGRKGDAEEDLRKALWYLNRAIEKLSPVEETSPAPDYDGQKDFAGSLDVGYEAIRQRVANGGPGWEPNRLESARERCAEIERQIGSAPTWDVNRICALSEERRSLQIFLSYADKPLPPLNYREG